MAENKNAQQVREITDKLEQGIKELFESEKFKEYLTTMSKFYHYSFNNTLLIAMQKPEATYVAGYSSWKKNFGRQVRAKEHGIRILAPAPYKTKHEMEKIDPATQKPILDKDGKPVTETVEVMHPSFKVVSVFDVSQTDGRELPDIVVDELKGSVENYAAFFETLKQESPVPIAFEDIPGGAKGYYHPSELRIAIQEGMSEIQTIKTAIHEIAHAKLHAVDQPEPDPAWKVVMVSDGGTQRDFLNGFASEAEAIDAAEAAGWQYVDKNRFEWRLEVTEDLAAVQQVMKDRHTKEVEAESVAYTVCQRYGIETSDYSFGYIAGWSSDKEIKELKGSLETIRKTAAEMIDSIDAKLKVLIAEKEQAASLEQEESEVVAVPDSSDEMRDPEVVAWERDEIVSFEVKTVEVQSPVVEEPVKPHRLTPDEKQIKEAVMDTLKGQIAHANDGMYAKHKTSEQSIRTLRQHNVKIEGNTVTRNGEPMFAIHRRHASRKTQGCYRELMPTLEYIAKEQRQEKPSIREKLKTAARTQPEKKAPAKVKSRDMGLE